MENQKKISVIGTGYVGLVTAVCFAKAGHEVLCFDVDKKKIAKLSRGECTIFEPSLEDLLKEAIKKKKIKFTSDKKICQSWSFPIFMCWNSADI